MLGAIIGDIAGSLYEFESPKTKDIELFAESESLTAHANSIKVRFED